MARFQVEATMESRGYIDVEAPDAETARKMLQGIDARVAFAMFTDADFSLFDSGLEIRINSVTLSED